jgi:3-hydroxyacyl-[acyl-carrier-protein] dehydratase
LSLVALSTEIRSVTDTLLARHRPEDRVAGEHTAADLLRDAAAVAEALPPLTADRPLALLGIRRDVYASLAALLGAWSRGYEVLVPPADCTRNGFLRLAQRADVGAVLHDTASSAALPIARVLASARPEQRLPDARCAFDGMLRFAAPEAHADAPELRVDGSSLLREAVLVGHGLGLPTRGVYATLLQPCTRYAWAIAVFWPLLSGSALSLGAPARTGGWVEPGLGDASRARTVLIAAPAQLRLLARREPAALRRYERIVSVGAPLVAATRAALPVTDVYANSQLGCVGYRHDDGAFQPLPELRLTPASEGIQVTAPHVAGVMHAIPIAAGGFVATGVGPQRAEREEQIAWIDGVHDAALLPLPEGRIGCALSLEDGVSGKQVRAALIDLGVDEWRSVRRQRVGAQAPESFASGRPDLTRNVAGRHDRVSLLRLFGRAADAAPLSFELTVVSEHVTDTRCVRQIQVPSRYAYFEGHFPGYPLLPGAAQLSELVVPFARSVRPELGRLTRMARLKFQERIVPNDVIDVCLELGAAGVIDFSLRRGDSVCATGRLHFEAT